MSMLMPQTMLSFLFQPQQMMPFRAPVPAPSLEDGDIAAVSALLGMKKLPPVHAIAVRECKTPPLGRSASRKRKAPCSSSDSDTDTSEVWEATPVKTTAVAAIDVSGKVPSHSPVARVVRRMYRHGGSQMPVAKRAKVIQVDVVLPAINVQSRPASQRKRTGLFF